MPKTEEKQEAFRKWCIVEVMGHRKLGGLVSEQILAGYAFVRVDVYPGDAAAPTQSPMFNPSSLYGITPCTEELARRYALNSTPDPVAEWELPRPRSLASGMGSDEG